MRDKNALTGEPPRRWACYILVGLTLGLLLVVSVYIAVRLRAVEDLRAQVMRLDGEHRHVVSTVDLRLTDMTRRLDELERVLFGNVLAKIERTPPQAPPPAPRWLREETQNLRERIERLERWRLEMLRDQEQCR